MCVGDQSLEAGAPVRGRSLVMTENGKLAEPPAGSDPFRWFEGDFQHFSF